MILLQCVNLSKSFGAEPILSNIKLEVKAKDRIALVGRNGAGKSTLLKVIAGIHSYDSGELIIPKNVSISYLAQDTGLESNLSIWEEMLTVFAPLRAMEAELRKLEQKMGDPDLIADEVAYQKLLNEYDEMQVRFKDDGGYQYEAAIRGILAGFRFDSLGYDTLISTLSGGQKTRLALAKLLLTKPDLLILDEPTNHLDIETLQWLEQYLLNYEGAILIVSHDRYFLDRIVNVVYELSRTKTTKFHGNYSDYLEEKARLYQSEMRAFEKQQDEIAQLEDFIQKNIARASTTKRAQSRRKQLDKIERLDRPAGYEKSASFSFSIQKQTGNDVLKVDNLAIGYEKSLAKNINFHIQRGERIALIGPNGIGKSTLLKTIIGQLKPLEGSFTFGSNVSLGYYDQQQAKLTSNRKVLDELWEDYKQLPEKEIRTVLGNFLFSGDDVDKLVLDLSGGEKARLALAKLMMQQANVLILDEPTNHLDLDSKEVLEAALIDYPGTILFVSHDRYFINRMTSRVIELDENGGTNYLGDYDYFLMKKDEARQREELTLEKQPTASLEGQAVEKRSYERDKEAKRKERQLKRRIEEIEQTIEQLDEQIAHHEEALCIPENYQDHEKAQLLQSDIDNWKVEIDALMEEWEILSLEISEDH